MIEIGTSAGAMRTLNPWKDRSIASEVIEQDVYRLRNLQGIFTPWNLMDVGIGAGQVSKLARQLWPEIRITGFEIDGAIADVARANIPDAQVVTAEVGYGLKSADLVERYGYADLLCIDCEGGEVPFFYNLYQHGKLDHFKAIVGEWHHYQALHLLQECLEEKYLFAYTEPAKGAGPWHYFFALLYSAFAPTEIQKLMARWKQPG